MTTFRACWFQQELCEMEPNSRQPLPHNNGTHGACNPFPELAFSPLTTFLTWKCPIVEFGYVGESAVAGILPAMTD
jgi:hypothetical protein